jgi:predicted anti-sigma-YlaC factor YlaD
MEDACRDVQEIMPWVVNGSADDAQRQLVDDHIAECEACRRELVRTSALMRRVGYLAAAMPPADDGWGRLAEALALAERPAGDPVLRTVLGALRALGMPDLVSGALEAAFAIKRGTLAVRLALPFVAPVEVPI